MSEPSPLLLRARQFAVESHGNQLYDGMPYVCHLDQVASIAARYGLTEAAVAFLHDVLEDTKITRDEIAAEFGEHVAACVLMVTDPPAPTRKERKTQLNHALRGCPAMWYAALIVKAADRLANVRHSRFDMSNCKFEMYRNEHRDFKSAAYRPALCDEIWSELDRLLS